MLNLFKSKHTKLLGIDISSASVKLMQLSKNGDEYTVEAYGRAKLPDTAMEGNAVKDADAVAQTIRRLATDCRASCKQAVVAVPDSSAISRVIQINEGLNEDDIEELVIMEVDKHIPYPIDEINIDFQVLGPSSKSASMLDVLVVASRTEKINDRVDVIKRAGLEAKIVDVESYAVERAVKNMAQELPAEGENKIIAVIDIGMSYTNFYVLHNFKNIFVREEEFGSKQLLDNIMERFDMSLEQAQNALDQNTLPEPFETEIRQPFHELILLQVKRGLQFFFSSSRHTFVDQILIAGGVANSLGLADLLEQHINIPTKIVNPCKHMLLAKHVDKERFYKDCPSLIVACGLALRA